MGCKKWASYKDIYNGALSCNATSRTDLYHKKVGAYASALKKGFLDQLERDLNWEQRSNIKWSNYDLIKEKAINIKATSLGDFKSRACGAYCAALKNKWHIKLAVDLGWKNNIRSNAIYIWLAHGVDNVEGKLVYKIGKHTFENDYKRIKEVEKLSGFDAELIINTRVDGITPSRLEVMLLAKFDIFHPDHIFSGSSEFRLLDSIELQQALEIIKKYAK